MSEKRYVWAVDLEDAADVLAKGYWYGDQVALFRDHMHTADMDMVPMAVTFERIEPEAPRWWTWDAFQSHWDISSADFPTVDFHQYANGTVTSVTVYGTTADRDAKRDALLAAAKAAGKEPQP